MIDMSTRELALALTAIKSVTDSPEEKAFAQRLKEMLSAWPYFSANPDRVRLVRTIHDHTERYCVVAAVGPTPESLSAPGTPVPTVILTGHYDVVSEENYGALAPWAFNPEELAPRLIEALEAEREAESSVAGATSESSRRALEDLRSGEFLPGRGLLDMKGGLAAGLTVLREYASEIHGSKGEERSTNQAALLFLAVPDEEVASHGMLSAVQLLPGILNEWGMEAKAAINLDSTVDQGDGQAGRSVFLGSVGKIQPFVLFVGRPTHAGAPFDGLNPVLPAAEFARSVECANDLFDKITAHGGFAPEEPAPPPTLLYFRELRDHYDITTPESVFISVNVLTTRDGPEAVLAEVSRLAALSIETALATIRSRAEGFSKAAGQQYTPPDTAPRVIAWSELEAAATAIDASRFEQLRESVEHSADRMGAFATFVADAARLAGISGPAAVVGVAPNYYPRATLDPQRDSSFLNAVSSTISWAEAEGLGTLSLRPFFPGVSDMSFLYPSDEPDQRRFVVQESPIRMGYPTSEFRCPIVNIGPWGRDYHQRLERMHAQYGFEALPVIINHLCRLLMAPEV